MRRKRSPGSDDRSERLRKLRKSIDFTPPARDKDASGKDPAAPSPAAPTGEPSAKPNDKTPTAGDPTFNTPSGSNTPSAKVVTRQRRMGDNPRGQTRRMQRTHRSKHERGERNEKANPHSHPSTSTPAVAQRQLDELQHDLSIATEIQANLLPKKIPRIEGYDFSAYYRPSKHVGGDYYDFIELAEGRWGLVVADVSGKGVAGSMVMTMFRSVLRMHAEASPRACDPLVATNRQVARDIKRGMFVTCLYMVFDPRTAEIRVCSAGHNPLLYWRAKQSKVYQINPRGIAIGFDSGPIFERSILEQKFVLEAGDRIVAYTDGIIEAMNEARDEFGNERLASLTHQHGSTTSGRFVNMLISAVDAFVAGAEQSDDITLMTVRRRDGD
jgi:hypothetical protein